MLWHRTASLYRSAFSQNDREKYIIPELNLLLLLLFFVEFLWKNVKSRWLGSKIKREGHPPIYWGCPVRKVGKSFKEWTTGMPADESVICTVGTAQSALALVAVGVGIAFIPNKCVQQRPGIRFVPLKNWHQAMYMCILYDKWLEPPVCGFVERIVKSIRESASEGPASRNSPEA